jgi:hypothetical protein
VPTARRDVAQGHAEDILAAFKDYYRGTELNAANSSMNAARS